MPDQKLRFKMNKRAEVETTQPLSIWLILVILVTLGVIVLGVYLVCFLDIDVRNDESQILTNRLIGAISSGGYLNEKIFGSNFSILKEAGIDRKSIEDSQIFYFNVSIFHNGIIVKSFVSGNRDFEIICRLSGKNFPECYEKELLVLDKKNNFDNFKIFVLTGSNNKGGYIQV